MPEDTLRVLLVSDLHMSNKLPHAQLVSDGMTDRLGDQLKLWDRIHRTASKESVAATFVLGDLFDRSLVDAVTLTHTVEAIANSPVPIYILPGNHDAISTQGGRFTVEAFGRMRNADIHYMESGQSYSFNSWMDFWPIEYCAAQKVRDLHLPNIRSIMKSRSDDRPDIQNVLLLHHSIVGCKHLGWVCDDGLDEDEVCKKFQWAFSGHFHDTQTFGRNKGMYLGAPMHHRFDDEGRRAGYWIVDFCRDGSRELTFKDGRAPRFHSTSWPEKQEVRKGDYLRVEVQATHAEFADLKPSVVEYVQRLRGDGVRADWKFRPVYHHTSRIKPHDETAKLKLEDVIDRYVDSVDVDTSGLDKVKLKKLGREALEATRLEWASSE